ncbi:DoxX family protein [Bacillus sp. FJAT-29790]|uniref:DoxX family protein n=1 Tax=Bacillus sp. FJAT-29790 TaxID=1895002 RepID=UPI001C22D7DA|nr:DoxX family protein [Bacillus sp. FJAT-29790]MBU8877975.1 DoxX family protein [Bacillus sp. FJAT-29790]
MIVKWLRENQIAAGLLTVIRVYLGYSWLTAGYHKVADGFDASGFLQGAVAKASGDHPAVQGWWASFLEAVAIPNAGLFSFLVAWGELLVGVGLILGCLTTAAAFFGIVMNFAFLFSGTVSTNAQMVLLTIFILVAGYNAGKIGIDRFVMPGIRKPYKRKGIQS